MFLGKKILLERARSPKVNQASEARRGGARLLPRDHRKPCHQAVDLALKRRAGLKLFANLLERLRRELCRDDGGDLLRRPGREHSRAAANKAARQKKGHTSVRAASLTEMTSSPSAMAWSMSPMACLVGRMCASRRRAKGRDQHSLEIRGGGVTVMDDD